MAELYGRSPPSFESYREGLPLKTAESIMDYSEAFWKNFKMIENYQKYIERITKGEQEIERRNQVDHVIEEKYK